MYTLLLVAAALSGKGDAFDVRAVPAADRLAFASAIANWSDEANAADELERAVALQIPVSLLFGWQDAKRREAGRWVDNNLSTLSLRDDWSLGDRDATCEYLAVHQPTISALRRATDRAYLYRPFRIDPPTSPPDPNEPNVPARLSEVLLNGLSDFRAASRLLALSARDLANGAQWGAALEENARIFRLARLARSVPTMFHGLTAGAIEMLGLEQLACFVAEGGVGDAPERLARIAADREFGAPIERVETIERLAMWDMIEQYYEWARDESLHPGMRRSLEMMIEPDTPGLKLGDCTSVDAFKDALRASSADDAWRVMIEAEAFSRQLNELPLLSVLKDAPALEAQYQSILARNPYYCLYATPFGPIQLRANSNRVRAKLDGLRVAVAVLAYRERNRRLPTALADATDEFGGFALFDPYVDAPFVYVPAPDGLAFRLYSVGPNQKDEDGAYDPPAALRLVGGADGSAEAATRDDILIWPPERPAFSPR